MFRIAIIVICAFAVDAGKLPSYITQCKKSDPKFEECLVHAANLAVPLLAKGDFHYDIPNMLPLKMSSAIIKNDKNLKFALYDVEIHGIETANITHATIDVEAGTAEFKFKIPELIILSNNYEINGRLLNTSVFGEGFANITLVDLECSYAPRFGPRSYEFDEHYELGGHVLKYTTKKTIYDLQNLYSLDGFSDYDLNLRLNEYWTEVATVFRPPTMKIMGDFITLILENLFKIVATDEYFKTDN